MEWLLAALKIVGLVGAFIGLADRAKGTKDHSLLRRSAPFLFLAVAIGAELFDARAKSKESETQEVRFEQTARPIKKVTIDVDETLPYAAISAVAPAYGKRIMHYRDADIVKDDKDIGAMVLNADDRDFPRKDVEGEEAVWQALNAFYEINLAFYRGTKETTLESIDAQKVEADFTTPLYGNPRRGKAVGVKGILTDAPVTGQPPPGREWAFTRTGIRISDNAAPLDLNDLAPIRHLHSIVDLKNAKFVLELCPRTGGDEIQLQDLHDEQAAEAVKLLQQVTVNVYMDGVGGFEIPYQRWQRMPSVPTCIRLYYSFPATEKDLNKLFGLQSEPS
jgi:hypothetical protein